MAGRVPVCARTRVYNLGGAAFSGRRWHFPELFIEKPFKMCPILASYRHPWWRNIGLKFRQTPDSSCHERWVSWADDLASEVLFTFMDLL